MLEGERGAVIAVEDYGGLERAPVLLGEALDRRRSSFDEQGFQLAVRKLLFRYRPKYGQAALRIFALGYFRVERHPAPAAGTQSACTPGDRPDVLVAMNPAALKANLGDLPRGGILIVHPPVDEDDL